MFTLRIKTDNAVFGDQLESELARILTEVASSVGGGITDGTVRDENGDTVATFKLTTRKAVTR